MKLTANFSDTEFFRKSSLPIPDAIVQAKLPLVAGLAQWLRDLIQSPGYISSYYRSPDHNASIAGASETSQHMTGEAVDLAFPLAAPRELAARVLDAWRAGENLRFGQIIFYPDDKHVHVSLPGATHRNEILLASALSPQGKRSYSLLNESRLVALSKLPPATAAVLIAVLSIVAATFFFPASAFAAIA